MSTSSLPKRLYQCRIDEVGPLAQMVRSSFVADVKDFGKASPDFAAPAFLKKFDERYDALELLVPTSVRRMSDAEVTRTMNKLAKSLRDPLNWLEIRVNRAAKKADPEANGTGGRFRHRGSADQNHEPRNGRPRRQAEDDAPADRRQRGGTSGAGSHG